MGRAVDFVDFVDGEIADSFKNYLSFPFALTNLWKKILLSGKKKGFVWEEWLIWVFDRGKQKPQLFVF